MQGLVVGAGSIGRRHLQNLQSMGVDRLAFVESDGQRRAAIESEIHLHGFAELSEGLAWHPDFVVIATPPHLHAEQALTVVEKGLAVFIEKPLSHNSDLLQKICDVVERKRLVSMVACNMRFHPGPAQVKKILDKDRIGRVLFARIQMGSYLPGWRPAQDYRDNYAARAETGGGCILDCIHEIDLARWYLGDVETVSCLAAKLSSIAIATEDVAELICRHESGALSEIHLDYVQRSYERDCQIVGEHGSIFWNFNGKQVRWFDAASEQWTTFPEPVGWVLNQMYVDEMSHFLDCVRSGKETVLPISQAVSVLDIALAAKASAKEGRLITTKKEVPV